MISSNKNIARILISLIFITIGILHFTIVEKFVLIVPPIIPYAKGVVYISGIFEIIGGIGILIPKLKRPAATALGINQTSWGFCKSWKCFSIS